MTSPTVWGEVLACAWGDLLDVLGHFDGGADDLHNDWLRSLCDSRVQDLERISARVADRARYAAEHAGLPPRRRSPGDRSKRRSPAPTVSPPPDLQRTRHRCRV